MHLNIVQTIETGLLIAADGKANINNDIELQDKLGFSIDDIVFFIIEPREFLKKKFDE